MNLRIAHVIGALRVGGAEKQFVNLMNESSAERKLAVFVSPRPPGPGLDGELQSTIRQVRQLVSKKTFVREVLKLRDLFRQEQIYVVHSHMFWANIFGVIAARLSGVQVICTSEHGENRWKNSMHRLLERYVISPCCTVRFCVSPRILERRRDIDGVPADKLQLLPNGTLMPALKKVDSFDADEICIGSVGRFVTQKNFELLIDVIDSLRHRGRSVRAAIVGDGPEMPAIKASIERRGLGDVIVLPGMDTNVSRWYREFDIYACTSVEEGLPVTIIEAMSYGLPIVSTDVGAISEVARDDIEGRIVAAGRLEEFVQAVEELLDNPEQAAELGRRGRRRAETVYSIEAVTKALETIYYDNLTTANTGANVKKSIG